MLELKNFMPVNYLKKETFTGSHKGMRFRMEKSQPHPQAQCDSSMASQEL